MPGNDPIPFHLICFCLTLCVLYLLDCAAKRRAQRRSTVHGRGTPPPDADKRNSLDDWRKRGSDHWGKQ